MGGETREIAELLNPTEMATRHQLGLAGLALLFVIPFVAPEITTYHLIGALLFAVFVMSWDAVSGYTGEISFGHGLFFGVGGYASGLLNLHYGVDPVLGAVAGTVAAAFAGLVIGFPSLRLRGPYFSLVTLVAPIILVSVFRIFPNVTGGELGLVSVGTVQDFSYEPLVNYYVALALFVFALVVFLAMTRSDMGIVLTGIREDEIALEATGINPAKFKLAAFVLSGAVGGLAGAVYVHSYYGSATPSELLALTVSIEVIIAAILGGMGTITGAAIGGLFFHQLRTVLRNTPGVGEFYFLVFAVVTLAFLFLLPQGIVPAAVQWGRNRFGTEDGDAVADGGEVTPLESTVQKFVAELREMFGGERR